VRRLLQDAQDKGYTQAELGKALKCGQSHVSNIMKGRNGAGMLFAYELSALMGVDPAKLLGLPASSAMSTDPQALAFLDRLESCPGLEDWLDEHNDPIRLSELVRVVAAYEAAPPAERDFRTRHPRGGWGALIRQVTGHSEQSSHTAERAAPPMSVTKPAPGVTPVAVIGRKKSE
jgi:transcriptional regulator with XRE-family HTH domain